MATYYQPPPPFVGGVQPNAGHLGNVPSEAVPANNPPFAHLGRTAIILAGVLAAWVAPDPLPTLPTAKAAAAIPPVATIVGKPNQAVLWSALAAWWAVPDALPTLSKKLTPPSVDNPPGVSARQPLAAWWPAPDPQPPLTIKLVQPLIAAAGQPYAVSWLAPVLSTWAVADPLPTQAGKLSPQITAVPVNNPPGIEFSLSGILSAWQPPDPIQVARTFRIQSGAAIAPQQPTAPNWLTSVVASWSGIDPLPALRNNLSPQIIAVRVDNPPGIELSLANVLAAWQAPDPAQPVRNFNVQSGVAPAVTQPFSPSWFPIVFASWQQADGQPILPVHTPQGTSAFVPYASHWLQSVLAAWAPVDPISFPTARFTPGLPVNNPPLVGGSAALPNILGSWVFPDPAQPILRFVAQPRIFPVDNPPLASAVWLPGVLSAWQPLFILPAQLSTLAPIAGPPGPDRFLSFVPVEWSLVFPAKTPGSILNYTYNATPSVTNADGSVDTVVSSTIATSPSGAGEMYSVRLRVSANIVTVWMAGGVPGRQYIHRLTLGTYSGATLEVFIGQLCDPLLAASPLPPPQSPYFGAYVTWP